MLHEFRLINVRSENNERICFVYGEKSFRSHWNVGAVYIAPKITIAVNMENEKGMGSGTTSEYSLRRFIARRGRPRIIYCDNGTNFRGAFNDLAKLDWHKISRETSTQKIVWKFIPPTATWWGGWWERLVRIIKELLKRSLGKSILSYEELSTVICDCEFLINSRPLTYIPENPQELIPLTPAMFLIENRCSDTTDIDELNSRDLRKRIKYRIKLLSDLRQRFRKEYLSELIQKQ
ncbi:integrase catalytic domain-containing protein [Trichonephila clavipes]|nr:integrase catalytic domain-containing protein [Trichonephila clavipes]